MGTVVADGTVGVDDAVADGADTLVRLFEASTTNPPMSTATPQRERIIKGDAGLDGGVIGEREGLAVGLGPAEHA